MKKKSKLSRIARKIAQDAIRRMDVDDWVDSMRHPLTALEYALKTFTPAALGAVKEELEQEKHTRKSIPKDVRAAVLQRDNNKCVHCGKKKSLELHHYIFVCKGGQNTTGNLVTLCAVCHALVHRGDITIAKPRSVSLKSAE